MGLFDFFTNKHFDEQDDGDDFTSWSEEEEEEECTNEYERGQAYARKAIDERRQNYQQYGYSSFRESVEVGGKIWHRIVEQEQDQVNRGQTDRQGQLDYARGARSQYD